MYMCTAHTMEENNTKQLGPRSDHTAGGLNHGRTCTWTAEHRLDGARGESVLPLHDELVAVAGNELDVHRLGPLHSAHSLLPSKLRVLCAIGHLEGRRGDEGEKEGGSERGGWERG